VVEHAVEVSRSWVIATLEWRKRYGEGLLPAMGDGSQKRRDGTKPDQNFVRSGTYHLVALQRDECYVVRGNLG
jgi:hypothetical protein